MKNKISILLTMLFTLISLSSFAQTSKPGKGPKKVADPMAAEKVAKIDSICGLSADQKVKITNLMKDVGAKKQSARKKYSKGSTELVNAQKEIHKNRWAQMKTILTPEQIAKLKEYNKTQKAKGVTPSDADEDLDIE